MCVSVTDDLISPPLKEEALPLNELDKAWIREAIRESQQGRGWGRVRRVASEWAPLSIMVAIGIFMVTQWGDYRQFNGETTTRLNDIDKRLTAIEGRNARQTAITHSALPTAEFRQTLPELSAALYTLRAQKVTTPPSVVNSIQEKLADAGTDAPGFWPAASELVSYKSQQANQYTLTSQLPDCVDHDPSPSRILSGSQNQMTMSLPTYKNCKFTLDSRRDGDIVVLWLKAHPFPIIFDHCLIVYHGGQVYLPTAVGDKAGFVLWIPKHLDKTVVYPHGYEIKNPLRFQGCAWNIELQQRPPDFGIQLTEALLQSANFDVEFAAQSTG